MSKHIWRFLALGLVCALTACSLAEERAASPTSATQPTTAATSIAEATPGRPTPTFVPTGGQPAASSPPIQSSAPPVANPPTNGSASPILLEDPAWQGGYRRASGNSVYGGRTAAWIYGSSTEYSTMQATFSLAEQPGGTAELRIEGMDSEGAAKTPIRISVNGAEIFNGPNPLPDDDLPLDSGTWASYTWRFEASLLRPGENAISISNLAPGAFSRPPFFMLDYAEIRF